MRSSRWQPISENLAELAAAPGKAKLAVGQLDGARVAALCRYEQGLPLAIAPARETLRRSPKEVAVSHTELDPAR
jgi:predicted ATPase